MESPQLHEELELQSPTTQGGRLLEKLGYGLGLNSMQSREAKHIKLALYVQNTCNVRKSIRWWTVSRAM